MKNCWSDENPSKKGTCNRKRAGFAFYEPRHPFGGGQTNQPYRKNKC
jgi:hypothetical protein